MSTQQNAQLSPRVGLITVSLEGEGTDLAKKFALSAYENLKREKIEIFKPEKIGKTEEEILSAVKNSKNKKWIVSFTLSEHGFTPLQLLRRCAKSIYHR